MKLIFLHLTGYFLLFAFALPLPGTHNHLLFTSIALAVLTELVLVVGAAVGYFASLALRIDRKLHFNLHVALSAFCTGVAFFAFFYLVHKIPLFTVSLDFEQALCYALICVAFVIALFDISRRFFLTLLWGEPKVELPSESA